MIFEFFMYAIYTLGFVLVTIVTIFLGARFNPFIIQSLFGSSQALYVLPTTFASKFSSLTLLGIVLFIYLIRIGEHTERSRRIWTISLTIIFAIAFVQTYYSYTTFYEAEIKHRDIFHIVTKSYSYDSIQYIDIWMDSGKFSSGLHYDLIMDDGVKINFNAQTLENNDVYYKEKKVDFFFLENKVPHHIPRYITSRADKFLKYKGVDIPESIY